MNRTLVHPVRRIGFAKTVPADSYVAHSAILSPREEPKDAVTTHIMRSTRERPEMNVM